MVAQQLALALTIEIEPLIETPAFNRRFAGALGRILATTLGTDAEAVEEALLASEDAYGSIIEAADALPVPRLIRSEAIELALRATPLEPDPELRSALEDLSERYALIGTTRLSSYTAGELLGALGITRAFHHLAIATGGEGYAALLDIIEIPAEHVIAFGGTGSRAAGIRTKRVRSRAELVHGLRRLA